MITGTVLNRRATLQIAIRLPNDPDLEFEAVIDTGFSGYLTLAAALFTALGLPFSHLMNAFFADGSFHLLPVHKAAVAWDGKVREVEVVATGQETLIGMTLLEGFDVRLQVVDGGAVTIEAL